MTNIEPKAPLLVPAAAGELVDKITILELKQAKISDPEKLLNIKRELVALTDIYAVSLPDNTEVLSLRDRLKEVNETLWDVEDQLRVLENKRSFGPDFIALARSVYKLNDQRAALKRQVNYLVGSDIVEEKSYKS